MPMIKYQIFDACVDTCRKDPSTLDCKLRVSLVLKTCGLHVDLCFILGLVFWGKDHSAVFATPVFVHM
jgi:hypothetical protein